MQSVEQESVRINKYLATSGICSRREADKLIEQGKVTINGRVAQPGDKVTLDDKVLVGKKEAGKGGKKVVLAFYKPRGITCTEKDRHADKIISDLVKYPVRVTYAGRLDKESEGLLLLTNDGELIQRMMKGSNHHEKEYVVKTDKEITADFIRKMEQGVYLKELEITTKPCKMKQVGRFTFHIVLTQGVNRQIRRMCQTFGYKVENLKRVRVMNITLEGLKNGEFRELYEEELALLYEKCGLKR